MGFSRQEYSGGLPFPSPGDLPNSGIKPGSPTLQADALLSGPPGKCIPAQKSWLNQKNSQKYYIGSHVCVLELFFKVYNCVSKSLINESMLWNSETETCTFKTNPMSYELLMYQSNLSRVPRYPRIIKSIQFMTSRKYVFNTILRVNWAVIT